VADVGAERTAPEASPSVKVAILEEEDAALADRCRKCPEWLVFSDLHMSKATMHVALEVLEQVHNEAAQRNAGIAFLGDFWHVRGALPVEPLNEVIHLFKEWTRPTILLAGNHDQVDIGGSLYSLEAMAATAPRGLVRVIDTPTIGLGALWLPYRKRQEELVGAIAASVALPSRTIAVVFCHADVRGAKYNEGNAAVGISPNAFPNVPVYSGHYHLPQKLLRSGDADAIEYVGSPYQLSFGEANQAKRMLRLSGDSEWKCLGEVPLDIGPQHFVADGVSNLEESIQRQGGMQSGDRLRVTLSAEEASAPATQAVLVELCERGMRVESVLRPSTPSSGRITKASTISPRALLQAYSKRVEMSEAAMVAGDNVLTSVAADKAGVERGSVHIRFESVSVKGFGPFLNEVTYPLLQRGARLVTGRNVVDADKGDSSTKSNGSGKTAPVMAPLWALTGASDPRPNGSSRSGLTGKLVVNTDAKKACVVLEGFANDKRFRIQR